MIKEALEYLKQNLTVPPAIQTVKCEPEHVYFLNGSRYIAEPFPRSHKAKDLDTIAAWANLFSNDKSHVWYDRDAIIVVLDNETRRDWVIMRLNLSDPLKTIIGWGQKSGGFEQTDLILLFRTMFKGCLDKDLIAILRKVKFSSSGDSERTVTTTKTSIGKKIEQEASGAMEIPDDFIMNVPVFANTNLPMTGNVEVAISINVQSERFFLHPVPGHVERVVADAERELGKRLTELLDDESKLFYGCP